MTTTALIDSGTADGWTMHGDGSWWWMGGMMIWWVILWVALVLGVVWLIRGGSQRNTKPIDGAIGVLDRRLAEGAISVDEYQELKTVLTGPRIRRTNRSISPTGNARRKT